jgi:hypothetical protein
MYFSNISNKSKERELIGVVFNQDGISRPMGAYPTPTVIKNISKIWSEIKMSTFEVKETLYDKEIKRDDFTVHSIMRPLTL